MNATKTVASHSFEDSASDINVNLWPKDVL